MSGKNVAPKTPPDDTVCPIAQINFPESNAARTRGNSKQLPRYRVKGGSFFYRSERTATKRSARARACSLARSLAR